MQAWTEGPPSPLSAEPPPPAPRGGLALAFSNIRFTVKDRKSGQPHDILKGISGEVGAGLAGPGLRPTLVTPAAAAVGGWGDARRPADRCPPSRCRSCPTA